MAIHRIRESFVPSAEFWAKQRLVDPEEFKETNPDIYSHYKEAQEAVEKGTKRLRESQKNQFLNTYRESGLLDQSTLDKLYSKDPSKISVKFWRVPISRYDNMCGNKRIYTLPLWRRVRDKQVTLWKGIPGLCDHPKEDDDPGELKYACIVWLGIEIDEENKLIWGIGVFVGDLGRMLQEIIEVGGRVGFSTSGFGETIAEYLEDTTGQKLPKNDERNYIIRPESFIIERLADVVINPSQQVFGNTGIYEDSMSSKATKAEVIEYTNKKPEVTYRESQQKSKILAFEEEKMKRMEEGQALNSIVDAVNLADSNQNTGTETTQAPAAQAPVTPAPANPAPAATPATPAPANPAPANPAPANPAPAATPAENTQPNPQTQGNTNMAPQTPVKESLTLNDTMLHKYVESYINKDLAQTASPVEKLENLKSLKEQVIASTNNQETLKLVQESIEKAEEELKHYSESGKTIENALGEDSSVEALQALRESNNLIKEDNEDLQSINKKLVERNQALKKESVLASFRENKIVSKKDQTIKALREELETKNLLLKKMVAENNKTSRKLQEAIQDAQTAKTRGQTILRESRSNKSDLEKLSEANEKLLSNNTFLAKENNTLREDNKVLARQNVRLQKLVEKYSSEADTARADLERYKEEQEYKNDPRNHIAPNKSDVVGSFLNFRESNGDTVTAYWNKLVDTYGDAVMPLRESINNCKTKSEAARVFLNNKDLVDGNFNKVAKMENIDRLPKGLRESAQKKLGIEQPELTREEANSRFGDLMARHHLGGK